MTYQQPGGQQSDQAPGYGQPQDPWASEQGVASMPTDPIPQQYDHPSPTPSPTPPSVWSQATQLQGTQYGGRTRGRAGLFVLVFTLVLVLGGGGGFAAWYIVSGRQPVSEPTTEPGGQSATGTPPPAASCPVGADEGRFDPCAAEVGDCFVNQGTDENPFIVGGASCTEPGAYQIIKVLRGVDIREGPSGGFDRTTASLECPPEREHFYGYDFDNDYDDVFLCLTRND